MIEKNDERGYELIEVIVRTPDTDKENDTWFDRIFDLVSADCIPLEDPDNVPDDYECPCGMVSMGGSGGTLDQIWEHQRLTEKWAVDVLADDLKLALHRLAADTGMDDEAYARLRKAAYWHDDFNDWLANVSEEEDDEGTQVNDS